MRKRRALGPTDNGRRLALVMLRDQSYQGEKNFAHELFVKLDMIDLIRGHAFIPTKERISELTSSTSYYLSVVGFNRPLPRHLHNDHENVGLEFRNVLFFFFSYGRLGPCAPESLRLPTRRPYVGSIQKLNRSAAL